MFGNIVIKNGFVEEDTIWKVAKSGLGTWLECERVLGGSESKV